MASMARTAPLRPIILSLLLLPVASAFLPSTLSPPLAALRTPLRVCAR
eukprot:CAMPEP_0174930924 /NCGR_PEP_ID=MMETSP1355-20121228/31590_1 /TAXON_ID=464990 /ORGANISM="Hemiselmis tepida, Strain CCMP443" /LENGTH=47 /DNA_ID= /DNA_START= /DNA_END= /DNA_ORIENTATION=